MIRSEIFKKFPKDTLWQHADIRLNELSMFVQLYPDLLSHNQTIQYILLRSLLKHVLIQTIQISPCRNTEIDH